MTQLNKAILWTAIAHALILIPFGHRGGPLIIFETGSIPRFLNNSFKLYTSDSDSYGKAIAISSFISLVGHILMVVGLSLKLTIRKLNFIWSALALMIISSLNIIIQTGDLWGYIFAFSLPFFGTSIWMMVSSLQCWKSLKIPS